MKEIRVATLTKEEIKELKELCKMKGKIETLVVQANSAHTAWWKKVMLAHSLLSGNHYVLGNTIYRQDIE